MTCTKGTFLQELTQRRTWSQTPATGSVVLAGPCYDFTGDISAVGRLLRVFAAAELGVCGAAGRARRRLLGG